VSVARELGRLARRDPAIEVHLVSNENFFVFQPLLPEIVACGVEPAHILNPIRQLCPDVHFHCRAVESFDPTAKTVTLAAADSRHRQTLSYDHLVLALGLTIDLSRTPGMAEHSKPIKTLGDAFHLRNHVLDRLEQADIEPDEGRRRQLLTVVAVGGGFSGVETVAEINDMLRGVIRFYPRARVVGTRMILVHSRDRILNELTEGLARFAEKKLRQRGVEIILDSRVKEATPEGVILGDDRRIPAGTVICTVGNAPHPLVSASSLPQDKGRVQVEVELRVKGFSDIWALGDAAMIPDIKRSGFCPPTAQYALRQGRHCARNILAVISNRAPTPFAFGGLGQLAVVGHRCGVAEVFGLRIAGILAWFFWRSVYLSKLPGLKCKVRVAVDWLLDVVFPRDITKFSLERTDRVQRAHYRRGDVIVHQGEIGDSFYIIENGEVEVLQRGAGGEPIRVAVRKAGESFGEIALLKATPRTATVRCLTPVDVILLTGRDFRTLVDSCGVLRSRWMEDVEDRLSSPAACK